MATVVPRKRPAIRAPCSPAVPFPRRGHRTMVRERAYPSVAASPAVRPTTPCRANESRGRSPAPPPASDATGAPGSLRPASADAATGAAKRAGVSGGYTSAMPHPQFEAVPGISDPVPRVHRADEAADARASGPGPRCPSENITRRTSSTPSGPTDAADQPAAELQLGVPERRAFPGSRAPSPGGRVPRGAPPSTPTLRGVLHATTPSEERIRSTRSRSRHSWSRRCAS